MTKKFDKNPDEKELIRKILENKVKEIKAYFPQLDTDFVKYIEIHDELTKKPPSLSDISLIEELAYLEERTQKKIDEAVDKTLKQFLPEPVLENFRLVTKYRKINVVDIMWIVTWMITFFLADDHFDSSKEPEDDND